MKLTDEQIKKKKKLFRGETSRFEDDLLDTIEALQQEIVDWKSRYEELDAGHSKLFKDLCKMKQENDIFRADITDANVQMAYMNKVIGELKYEVQCHMDIVTEKCKEVESLQKGLADLSGENEQRGEWIDTQATQMFRLKAELRQTQADNERLTYTLAGIMHSVDKWFDKVDENTDEVNRAAQAREIALQAIEKRDEALKRAESLLKTIEQATEYIKPGTGVWHTVGIALQEIHKALAEVMKDE